jgi:alginate O-acetyltransferase complex protein AlgI
VFLSATVLAFWSLAENRVRNWLLFIAGSLFYGSWSIPFLFLLYATIFVDYVVGLKLSDLNTHRRKEPLLASIVFNLGVLAIFKYADFAGENPMGLLRQLGFSWKYESMNIALPLGISFYTFMSLSYTIDVYRRVAPPERSLLNYGVFVTFFPHLISGPILRAREFLPQLALPQASNYLPYFGITRIVIGLLKKFVLAGCLATFVDPV